jgi:hypothetical protein
MSTTFTDVEETEIRACRDRRLSWVKTALAIHRNPGDVRRHGKVMGLPVTFDQHRSPLPRAIRERAKRALEEAMLAMPEAERLGIADDREPLPPGHASTWGVICAVPFPQPLGMSAF